mgnify:CR=1 FL=1
MAACPAHPDLIRVTRASHTCAMSQVSGCSHCRERRALQHDRSEPAPDPSQVSQAVCRADAPRLRRSPRTTTAPACGEVVARTRRRCEPTSAHRARPHLRADVRVARVHPDRGRVRLRSRCCTQECSARVRAVAPRWGDARSLHGGALYAPRVARRIRAGKQVRPKQGAL